MSIAAIVAAVVGLFNRLADILLVRRRGAEIEQARADGANAADIQTIQHLSEIANAQSDNATPASDGVVAVAGRLQSRFDAQRERP